METRLKFEILPQPDDVTCGPTCLHAVYRYNGDDLPLKQVVAETDQLEEGGTLGGILACHALGRGFRVTIYTYNLQVFDPTWFSADSQGLAGKLAAQAAVKNSAKLRTATAAYRQVLDRGGEIRMVDLTASLIRKYLKRGIPILTGLSATYLYQTAREHGPNFDPDDVRGNPAGHFVVLCGYDPPTRGVLVADPLLPNPLASRQQHYVVNVDRVICAILLGILTHDANLLIIQPRKSPSGASHAHPDRRQ